MRRQIFRAGCRTGTALLVGLSTQVAVFAAEGDGAIRAIDSTLREAVQRVWRGFIERLPFLAAGLIIVLLTALLVGLVSSYGRKLLKRTTLRPSLQELLVRLTIICLWILGLLIAATVVFPGLTPTRALGALGVVSLAVGFAFKDIFENFFAGVLILWRFPFENGDFIECEGIEGKVMDVTIRMTLVRKTTGELVIVPNSFLFKNPVQIYTYRPRRRVSIIAGIAYGESVEEAVPIIQKAVESCPSVHPRPGVQVFPQGFGDSSIDIEVAWWTDPRPVDLRLSRGEVVTAVKRALDEAGIEIPFPYRTLTFKQPIAAKLAREDQKEQPPEKRE